MGSVNEVRIMGNLGADPELRYTASGTAVCTLSIATTRTWIDGNNEKQEDTQWHRVVVWSGQAESVHTHKKKGDQLYIAGRLQTREWEDKDGVKRYSTEIVAEQVVFTGRAPRGGPPHPADDPTFSEPPRARGSTSSSSRKAAGKKSSTPDDDYVPPPGETDIPF